MQTEPAFPQQLVREFSKEGIPIKTDVFPGISVRTYIATKVLAAIAQDTMNCGEKPEYAANAAVKFADALVAELYKP